MKQIFTFLLLMVFTTITYAQDLQTGTCALYNFKTYISGEYYKNLDNTEIYSGREQLKLDRVKKQVERLLMKATFEELETVFKEKHNITIKKDNLADKVFFDDFGFPVALLKKAAKKGEADYYIAFSTNFDNKIDLKSAMLKTKQIKPAVTITLTVGDAKGNKIHTKIKGTATVEKPIKAKEISGYSRVDLTDSTAPDLLVKPLIKIMKAAVHDLATNFQP